jgi:glyoxylase-like metal-dependent hydrolase (beta-lactamase superfamily II)
MDRRILLAGLAVAAAGPRLAMAQASAAAPAPGAPLAQAPGFYRFKLGDYTVTTVHDGFVRRANPLEGLVMNAPPEAVRAALEGALLPTQGLMNPYIVTFVDTGRGIVAFDAGTGGGQMAPGTGLLPRNMAAAGIRPEDVTLVAVSHFHGDHITGLTTAENQPFFPNAEVAVPAPEWAFWSDSSNEGRVPAAQRPTFANTARRFAPLRDRMRMFGDDAELAPGIRSIATPGHSPGHSSFHVSSGGRQLFVTADAAGTPALFLRQAGWHSVFDLDGAMAADSRRKLFGRIAAERAQLCAYHFNFPGTGFVAAEGDGFRFKPVDWSAVV